jgi:hypothetical protein
MSLETRVDRITNWCSGGLKVERLLREMHRRIDGAETVEEVNDPRHMQWFEAELLKLSPHELGASSRISKTGVVNWTRRSRRKAVILSTTRPRKSASGLPIAHHSAVGINRA